MEKVKVLKIYKKTTKGNYQLRSPNVYQRRQISHQCLNLSFLTIGQKRQSGSPAWI